MTNAMKQFAQANRKRNAERADRPVPRGGKDGGGKWKGRGAPVEYKSGVKFWPPRGIPLQENGVWVTPGNRTWINAPEHIEGILLGAVDTRFFHKVQRVVNSDVIHPRMRSNAVRQDYPCTYTVHDPTTIDVSSVEVTNEGPDVLLFGDSSVLQSKAKAVGGGYHVYPPEAHPYAAKPVPADNREEAIQQMVAWSREASSCLLCATSKVESARGVQDQSVWWAKEKALIPFFSLRELVGKPNANARNAGNFSVPTQAFKPNDFRHIEGWSWIDTITDKSSRSTSWQTWENYQRYLLTLNMTCKACLDNGCRTGKSHHMISAKSMFCEGCGESVLSHKEILSLPDFLDEVDDEGNVSRGFFQLLTQPFECSHCSTVGMLVPAWECSSCDKPTPIQPSDVITVIKKDSGGFYSFKMKEESGELFFPWRDRPLHTGATVTAGEMYQVGITEFAADKFVSFLGIDQDSTYPQLTPDEQVMLLGTSELLMSEDPVF